MDVGDEPPRGIGPDSAPDAEPGSLTVRLGGFTMARLREEAARQGVGVEELVAHAVAYYLADADAGRVSWPVPRFR